MMLIISFKYMLLMIVSILYSLEHVKRYNECYQFMMLKHIIYVVNDYINFVQP